MYTCKKIPYKTRREAITALKRHKLFDPGEPYKCKKCGFYHIGHEVPKKSLIGQFMRIKERKIKATRAILKLIDDMCGI